MKINLANRVTITRVLLIFPFIILMINHNDSQFSPQTQDLMRYGATVLFFAMAASDCLDGYLARKRGQCTKLGAFLDPMADKLLMASAALLLTTRHTAVNGFVLPTTVAVLIIGKDMFLLIGFLIVHFVTSSVKIVPAKVGKSATALQLTMVGGILLAPEISSAIPGWIWVLRLLWWTAAAVAIFATFVYIRTGSRYIEQAEHNNSK